MNLNKVFILGNLTRDPEVRSLPSGQPVVSFGVATNRFYTNRDGEKKQDAEFHNITAFGKLADISSQYLKKGSLVLIEGRIQTRTWQDSSGNKRNRTEIITERLQLGPRTASFQTTSPEPPASDQNQVQQVQKETPPEEIPIIEEEKPSSAETVAKTSEDKEEEIDVKSIPF